MFRFLLHFVHKTSLLFNNYFVIEKNTFSVKRLVDLATYTGGNKLTDIIDLQFLYS